MKKDRIIVHCLLANEERFVWYAINSVLPFVDRITVWDTGSTDRTVAIIKSIRSPKIKFVEKGQVDAEGHTKMRDQMLQETDRAKYDWLLILDGDEIWSETMFQKMLTEAAKKKPIAVVVKTVNFVGDIYHRTPESAGRYRFGDKIGHYNLRLINLQAFNLSVAGPHGQQTYFTGQTPLQDLPEGKLLFLEDVYYFHATHLPRSRSDQATLKRSFKRKYELGGVVPTLLLPKIFFEKKKPAMIPDVDSAAPLSFWLLASLLTIPRRLKRILFSPKAGY